MTKEKIEQLNQVFKKDLWSELHPHLDSIDMQVVYAKIEDDIKQGREVYPSPDDIFKAYRLTPPENVKAVILGQDPYHNGQAMGLSFGVNGKKVPPSLRNIYKELCNEFDHYPEEFDYSLEHWAQQGVLMLNTALTVTEKKPTSYAGMWDFLIKATLQVVRWKSPHAIHLLWGKHAQGYTKYITTAVLKAAHPAAESYSGGGAGFFGCGHFYQVNERLKQRGEQPIDWFKLPEPVSEQSQIDEYDDVVKS